MVALGVLYGLHTGLRGLYDWAGTVEALIIRVGFCGT